MENNMNYGEVLRGKMTKSKTANRPMTEKQKKLLVALQNKWNIVVRDLDTLTRKEASEKIDKIIYMIQQGKVTQRQSYENVKQVKVAKADNKVLVYVVIENKDGVFGKTFTGETKEEACNKAVAKYNEDIQAFSTDLEEVKTTIQQLRNKRSLAVKDLYTNTVRELREIASQYKMPNYNKLKKDDLVVALYLHAKKYFNENKGA